MKYRMRKKKLIEAIYNQSFKPDYIFIFDNEKERNLIVRKQAMIYLESNRLTKNIISKYYSDFKKKERKFAA